MNPVTLDRRAGLREQLREGFGHALVILARRRLHIWASENGGHVTSLGFGDDPEVTQIALVADEHSGGSSASRQPLHVVDEGPRALEASAVCDGEDDEEPVGPLHLLVRAGLARVLEHVEQHMGTATPTKVSKTPRGRCVYRVKRPLLRLFSTHKWHMKTYFDCLYALIGIIYTV